MKNDEKGTATLIIVFSLLALSLCLAGASRALQMQRLARIHEQQAMTAAVAWGAARVAAAQGGNFEGQAGRLAWKAAPLGTDRTVATASLARGLEKKRSLHAQAVLLHAAAAAKVNNGH